MSAKILIIFTILVLGSVSQSISISDLINQGGVSSTSLPSTNPNQFPNPVNPGIPVNPVNPNPVGADNFSSPADSPNFVPCNGQEYCGEATPIGSAAAYESFLAQNQVQAPTPQVLPQIQPAVQPQTTNLRGSEAQPQATSFQATSFQPTQPSNLDFSGTNNQ